MRRLGAVTLNRSSIMESDGKFNPSDSMRALQNVMIIYRTEEDYLSDKVKFYGYSSGFRELKEAEVIPEYHVFFRKVNDLVLVTDIQEVSAFPQKPWNDWTVCK